MWWLESIMVSSTQTHPGRQFNFTLTNTLHCALDKSSAQCTWWMWWLILCWANYALDKSAHGVGAFSTMLGGGWGWGWRKETIDCFKKQIQTWFSGPMRTKMEHLKLGEIAWAWEYLTILTVHWKWELQNQAALKEVDAKPSWIKGQNCKS